MDEIRRYLELLLDHQCPPEGALCRDCESLSRIGHLMMGFMAETRIYPQNAAQPRARKKKQRVMKAER
jgi:hypothetical protein